MTGKRHENVFRNKTGKLSLDLAETISTRLIEDVIMGCAIRQVGEQCVNVAIETPPYAPASPRRSSALRSTGQ